MERGPRYCHPSYLHRIENGVRVQRAGASDVDADVAEFGDGYLGCEFTGYRPARLASADHSQTLAQLETVYLHYHAVGLEIETRDASLEFLDDGLGFGERLHGSSMRCDGKPPRCQQVQRLVLSGDLRWLRAFDLKGKEPESATTCDLRVE